MVFEVGLSLQDSGLSELSNPGVKLLKSYSYINLKQEYLR